MNKKPFIRVAYMGDSHCVGGFGVGQDNWRNRLTTFFTNYYDVVEAHKFCNGGETIASAMPTGYPVNPGTVLTDRNITAALAVDPDLILMLYSGNHFANGYTLSYVQGLYDYLYDYLTGLGQKFAFATAGPRKTFFPGSTLEQYKVLSKDFNTWLIDKYPKNYFDIWQPLADPATDEPYSQYLLGDNLHYNAEGHLQLKNFTIETTYDIDDFLGYDKFKGYNLQFLDKGTTIDVIFKESYIKYLEILTSDDGITFDSIQSIEFSEGVIFTVPKKQYIQVIFSSTRGEVTITKQFE